MAATISTTGSSVSIFDQVSATTLTLGNFATAITIGATTGTATVRNAAISFPNATTISAGNAALTIDSLSWWGLWYNWCFDFKYR